ncbi:MAG: zinc-finger domain-containing protein [Caulobacterales bacterium]
MAADTSAQNSAPFPEEVVHVRSHRVSCEGSGGALGHPKVFYDIGASGSVTCLYCDRTFVLDKDAEGDDHH